MWPNFNRVTATVKPGEAKLKLPQNLSFYILSVHCHFFSFQDYVLLVPISSFSPSLLEVKPIDVTQDFIQDCGQYTFFLKDSSSKFCLQSAFTITTRFNSGAIKCNCDGLGSTKTSCHSFGGQCVCRPNVIGRACNRCKSGYSGFPYCRKLAT